MRTQDDAAFASQEFASQIAGRRNQIANTQIGLNLQAGELSQRGVESWREGGQYAMDERRFQMEQAQEAANLTGAELRIQQGREELDWARQVHDVTARRNLVARDSAQTALLIAQSKKALRELEDYQPDYATNMLSRAGLIASGIFPTRNTKTGKWDMRDSTDQEKEEAKSLFLAYRGRGSRESDPVIEESRKIELRKKMLDLATAAEDAGDMKMASSLRKEAGISPQEEAPRKKAEPLPPEWNFVDLGDDNSRGARAAIDENLGALKEVFQEMFPSERAQPNDDEVRSWAANQMRSPSSNLRKMILGLLKSRGQLDESTLYRPDPSKGWLGGTAMEPK